MSVSLTPPLRTEYARLFARCALRPETADEVDGLAAGLLAHRGRYAALGAQLSIPWWFIGAIHTMESAQNFACHLHNGDPLRARTQHIPGGRPLLGNPPFTWEQSAADALTMHGLGRATDWSLAGALYELERYNGFGYRLYHPQTLSPYLWSFSTLYEAGKYVADGQWSDSARSAQCGAATLMRRLVDRGAISELAEIPDSAPEPAPLHSDAPAA
jgi:lysozyme family protein